MNLDQVTASLQDTFKPVTDGVNHILPNLPSAIAALIVGIIIVRLLSILSHFILRVTHWHKALRQMLSTIIDVMLWVFLVITVLQFLGLSNAAIALTGSLAVVALGFSQGISSSVLDLFSGISLAQDKHFDIGDRVRVGDKDNRVEGIVKEINLRKTRLIDDDGKIHVISNTLIDRNEWIQLERKVDLMQSGRRGGIITRTKQIKRRIVRR